LPTSICNAYLMVTSPVLNNCRHVLRLQLPDGKFSLLAVGFPTSRHALKSNLCSWQSSWVDHALLYLSMVTTPEEHNIKTYHCCCLMLLLLSALLRTDNRIGGCFRRFLHNRNKTY